MIPMLPRQSTDDDRPAGLKLTRNNFLNFPKNDNSSSSINRAPSITSTVSISTSSIIANVSNQQPIKAERNPHRPRYSTDRRSPPSTITSSPTLPARSPFRIRDSQQQQQQSQNIKLSHDQKSNGSNSSIDIDSSVSSSSSSSIMTIEDDLTHEVESLWKYKSSPRSTTASSASKKEELTKTHISSDDMLLQLLISQAMIDAKDYKILKYEELETLKQHQERLKKQIRNSNTKLEIDKKIYDTSQSLTHLSANKNRESVIVLLDEAVEADRKVAILTQRLSDLRTEEVNTQYQILQHTAGVLYLGLQSVEQTNLDKKLSRLHSEVDAIKQTLRAIVGQYVKMDSLDGLSVNELLDQLEHHLARYRAQSTALESRLEAAEQKSLHEQTSEKKLEDELQATQAKRISAEAKCKELQQQIDSFMESWSPPTASDQTQQAGGETNKDGVKQELEAELEKAYADVNDLRQTVSDLEGQAEKLRTQVSTYQEIEDRLKADIDRYRTEVCQLRADKESCEHNALHDATNQQDKHLTDTNTPGESSLSNIEAKYELQLEEQEKGYQAQLKKQAAFLDESARQCEKLQEEYDRLSATCQDLELLIQQKQKALDARDAQIHQLEADLHQYNQQQQQQQQQHQQLPTDLGSSDVNYGLNPEIQQLQALFSEKESKWIEQSTALEANFEGILKEFDRLTGTAMEFEADKLNYERRIAELNKQVEVLEASLLEQKTKSLGYEGDTPTNASLRKEFRKMINDMKAEHQRVLESEIEERKRLERQLKDLKHEREMSRYERSNKGVQTLFIA